LPAFLAHSAQGHPRRSNRAPITSGLPRKADNFRAGGTSQKCHDGNQASLGANNSSQAPPLRQRRASNTTSLVGGNKQCWWRGSLIAPAGSFRVDQKFTTALSCIATTFERLPPVVFSTTVVFALVSRQGRPDGATEILSFCNRIR
jgi:hypothetical protein